MQNVKNNIRKDTMFFRNIPVFEYHIEYPAFDSSCNSQAAESINEYYLSLADAKEHYCRTILYSQAADAAQYIQQNSPPFHYYEFHMGYTITFNRGCTVSLYMEEYTFMGGAHGETARTSDTWDFTTGRKISLKELYPDDPLFKNKIIKEIERQITKAKEGSPQPFFDDYRNLVRDNFHPDSFYLTPKGTVIYFQQYDIAPYAAGFPEFLLPDI